MSEGQKTAVIFGLANKRSIAWAIAQKLSAAGWRLGIAYMNERLGLEAKDLIAELPGADGFMCDLTQDDQVARVFEEIKDKYGVIHGLVHSVGFAPPDELKKPFVETSREGFRIAHDISVYSLIAVARGAAPLMASGGGYRYADVLRRGKSCAELQRDGRGEGGAGSDRAISGSTTGDRKRFA